jgi:hypothetical protein
LIRNRRNRERERGEKSTHNRRQMR